MQVLTLTSPIVSPRNTAAIRRRSPSEAGIYFSDNCGTDNSRVLGIAILAATTKYYLEWIMTFVEAQQLNLCAKS